MASLIRDRRTNKEIAGELFLSLKTVESHVRNIFGKLGVSSRVDIARALEAAVPGHLTSRQGNCGPRDSGSRAIARRRTGAAGRNAAASSSASVSHQTS